jgi:hypothetical protein
MTDEALRRWLIFAFGFATVVFSLSLLLAAYLHAGFPGVISFLFAVLFGGMFLFTMRSPP